MEIKTVKEGIPIPKGILRQLGIENFEILTGKHEILILSLEKCNSQNLLYSGWSKEE